MRRLWCRPAWKSWRRFNPGWRVIALDRHSLPDYYDIAEVIDPARRDLDVIKMSNLTRLCLLRRYGGLWTDATVFCLRPLDDWLDAAYDAGFFAFRNPAKDRMLATWLIASEPDNPLLVALHAAFLDFVNRRPFSNQNTAFGRYVVDRLTPILRKDVRRTDPVAEPAGAEPAARLSLFLLPLSVQPADFDPARPARAVGARRPDRGASAAHTPELCA